MKLEEVAEARGAVDAHQDAVLHGCAEAHGQAVGACAGPVVGLLASCGYPAETLHREPWSKDGLHVPRCRDQEGCNAGAQKMLSPQIKEAGEMSYHKADAGERWSSRLQVLLNKGRGWIARHV